MDNKILIAGGVGAVGLVGFLFMRSRRTASNSEAENAPGVDAGMATMLYGAPAVGTGMMSDDIAGVGAGIPMTGMPMDASAGMGAGFNLEALMTQAFTNASMENMARIQSSIYTADTSSLAGINYGLFGGSGSVTHNPDGTVVTVKQNNDPSAPDYSAFLDGIYREALGRDPDASGKAFYLDAIKRGETPLNVATSIRTSAEAASRAAALDAQRTAASKAAYTDPNLNYTTTTTTVNENGQTVVEQRGSRA